MTYVYQRLLRRMRMEAGDNHEANPFKGHFIKPHDSSPVNLSSKFSSSRLKLLARIQDRIQRCSCCAVSFTLRWRMCVRCALHLSDTFNKKQRIYAKSDEGNTAECVVGASAMDPLSLGRVLRNSSENSRCLAIYTTSKQLNVKISVTIC